MPKLNTLGNLRFGASLTLSVIFLSLRTAIIKWPACWTLLTLETYNLCFIASKLLAVADHHLMLLLTVADHAADHAAINSMLIDSRLRKLCF